MLTFYDFMIARYLGKDNRYGDLAGDMHEDKDFPVKDNDRDSLRFYLVRCGACNPCLETFSRAWRNYRRALRKSQDATRTATA